MIQLDDAELARRTILGFGELTAALGRWGVGAEAEIRWPNALGARNEAAASNPWLNAAVVPPGVEPPDDDPRLPLCLWTLADAVPGRTEDPAIATPGMGVALDDLRFSAGGDTPVVEAPSFGVLGEMNERAYDDYGVFAPLVRSLRDDRIRTHGLRDAGGKFSCVALTMKVGDDLGVHFVATEARHRRRGLASQLLRAVLVAARADGMRSATLMASADGLAVYERLGFRRVATVRGFLRPAGAA